MDPDLIIRLPDGHHTAIALSATDLAPQALEPAPTPPPLFAIEGLRQVVQLIDRFRPEGRDPATERER